MRRLKFPLFLLIAAAIAYGIYSFLSGGKDTGMMGMPGMGGPMPALVAPVTKKDVTLWDEYSGRLTAVDHVQLRPRVSGMVDSVHFTDGQMVEKGDLLFIIDPRPYKAALDAAQAAYTLAASEFKRAAPLLKEKAISKRVYEQRKSAVANARAELTQAKLNMDYTTVNAPVSGKIGRREVTPGNLVNIGEPMLTTIVSQDPIYADFEADELRFRKYLAAYGSNAEALNSIPVKLQAPSGDLLEGKIQSFDNQLNTASGTIRVRAVFANPDGKLVPGMLAKIRVTSGDSGPALLVADSAIGTDQDKKFVYMLGEDNTASYREVKLGAAHGRMRIIRDGLKEGETIIVKGIMRVQPGAKIQPNTTTMEQAVLPPSAKAEVSDAPENGQTDPEPEQKDQ